MSVIMESLEGDPIVIIGNYVGCEHGTPFSWEKAREFNIGDIVYFVDYYDDKNQTQCYLSHLVIFKTDNGKIYSGNQINFVTMDEWNEITNHFKLKFGIKD